jgi:hypothetical protein
MGTPAPRVSLGRLGAGAGLLFAAYLAWGIYQAGLNETPAPPASTDIVFHNGIAHGERIKTRSWSADYEKLVSNADQTVLDLQNVRNGTIYKAGKPYLHMRAAHMTVNTLTRDFAVSGPLHVETVSSPPRSFDTTAAHWSDAQQQLDLNHAVSINSGAGAPLIVGRVTLNVKTGQLELHDIAGAARFK